MRLLAKIEGAPPAPATVKIPISTTPLGPSSAPLEPALIYVCPSLAPIDTTVTIITPLQASRSSLGT